MEKSYCVYLHVNPNTGLPFYVGIGSEKRAYDKRERTKYWKNYVSKIGDYDVVFHENGLDWAEACEVEKYLISKFGRKRYDEDGILVNLSLGGDGSPGVRPSIQTRKLLSQSAKERYPSVADALLKSVRGIKRTEEHKETIRQMMSGRCVSFETRRKISLANKGRKHSEEFRQKCKQRSSGINNPMYGVKRPEVANRNKEIKSIAVAQFDSAGLIHIRNFESISQASEVTGCDKSAIIRVCNGKQKTSLGYVWRRI